MNDNSEGLTFSRVADFVRAWAFVPEETRVDPDTQFERDLGITGDDGSEMLIATEKQFEVNLAANEGGYRETFGLDPSEYLFMRKVAG